MGRFVGCALRVAALCVASPTLGASVDAASLEPQQLKCEYVSSPLGVDAAAPRLSWVCEAADASARGLRQTAYQVQASPSERGLAAGRAHLWDSGRVASSESVHIEYAGKSLRSRQQVWWRVRLWDQASRPSRWSHPATFTMGILDPDDWRAKWIARPAGDPSLDGARWIWTHESDAGFRAPAGTRYFAKAFEVPPTLALRSARFAARADNTFTAYLNSGPVLSGTEWPSTYVADVTRVVRGGDNLIIVEVANTQEGEAGLIAALDIEAMDGRRLRIVTNATWSASVQRAYGYWVLAMHPRAAERAKVLGRHGMAPWGDGSASAGPLPILRRPFQVERPLRRAVVRVCGLGQYALSVNGREVNDTWLDPGWTNYRATCPYDTYDVTALLRRGENAMGVMLGNGMYNVTGGRYVKFTGSFGEPKLILELTLEYSDGSAATIGTDGSWRATDGPVLFSCTYGGEDHDARRECGRWNEPGYDERAWRMAEVVEGPGGVLRARRDPPVGAMEEHGPAAVQRIRKGVYVYDLGQNLSGVPRIAVTGPAGSTVRLVPGELVNEDGTVTQSCSGGPVWFEYTLRGEGAEVWSPRFSYYGFRYVQVEGAAPTNVPDEPDDLPRVRSLKSLFLWPRVAQTGAFECSNPDVGRVHGLILAAMKSNLKSVLTDCPHREKLGWLECSHLLAEQFMFDFDVAAFYAKIAQDMREAQTPEGLVPDIAPEYVVFDGGFRDSPEWGSACVIAPWTAYLFYGDRRILEDGYETMRRYVAYLGTKANGHILSRGLGDWCDIGPGGYGPSQLTSIAFTATAAYYQDIRIVQEVARLLGRADDAHAYSQLGGEVAATFNAAFYHPDSQSYDRGSQTANAMPLVLGLTPPEDRDAVLRSLVRGVRDIGNRVTAGDVGFAYVVRALADGERGDVLYDMVVQDRGPGYLYQLRHGATSLIETWDANRGVSQNHCMLGHAEEWFYRGAAGIRADASGPGFARFVLRPQIVPGLTWVRAHYDSVRGRIESAWEREGDRLVWTFRVPPNTTATVFVPARDAASVTEGGRSASLAPGLELLRVEPGCAVFEAGSGTYRVVSKL